MHRWKQSVFLLLKGHTASDSWSQGGSIFVEGQKNIGLQYKVAPRLYICSICLGFRDNKKLPPAWYFVISVIESIVLTFVISLKQKSGNIHTCKLHITKPAKPIKISSLLHEHCTRKLAEVIFIVGYIYNFIVERLLFLSCCSFLSVAFNLNLVMCYKMLEYFGISSPFVSLLSL